MIQVWCLHHRLIGVHPRSFSERGNGPAVRSTPQGCTAGAAARLASARDASPDRPELVERARVPTRTTASGAPPRLPVLVARVVRSVERRWRDPIPESPVERRGG